VDGPYWQAIFDALIALVGFVRRRRFGGAGRPQKIPYVGIFSAFLEAMEHLDSEKSG
jgi:hypothetical protein